MGTIHNKDYLHFHNWKMPGVGSWLKTNEVFSLVFLLFFIFESTVESRAVMLFLRKDYVSRGSDWVSVFQFPVGVQNHTFIFSS